MSLPTVCVLVLNFNGREHLAACLASVLAQDYPAERREVVMVDNGSSDGSVAFVRERYPAVRIIDNGANLGFAAGYNRAIQQVAADYVALLNNDTQVVESWLSELIRPCLADPRIACASSLMLNWNGDLIDFSDAALNYIGWGSQPDHGRPYDPRRVTGKDLLFACGGAMLIKRQAFIDAGCFDAGYFAYFEDVDLGWRLAQRGERVVLSPRALAYHRHHGTATLAPLQRWILLERNALFCVIKNYEDRSLAALLPAALLLACERAYLDLVPAGRPAVAAGTFGPGYYLRELLALLRAGDYAQLEARARSELGRRWTRLLPPRRPAPSVPVPCSAITSEMTDMAAARLVAGRAVLDALPALEQERREVQAQRRCPDRAVFRLFRSPLLSNFADPRFIEVMAWASRRFGVARLVAGRGTAPAVSEALLNLSRHVSVKIMEIMAQALAASGIERLENAEGQPALAAAPELAGPTVCALEDMDRILRSLPALPLADLLAWLDDRCTAALDRIQRPAGGAG